jgi:hypothetical protein
MRTQCRRLRSGILGRSPFFEQIFASQALVIFSAIGNGSIIAAADLCRIAHLAPKVPKGTIYGRFGVGPAQARRPSR